MGFNKTKCFTMRVTQKLQSDPHHYAMGDHTLETVNQYPYLGVELSSDMKWKRHLDQVVAKANKTLGLLRRNLHCCDNYCCDRGCIRGTRKV